MIRILIAKTEIPLKESKSFIPFVVDLKANLTSQENRINKIIIKMKYNLWTSY